jgi:hypothetical protein
VLIPVDDLGPETGLWQIRVPFSDDAQPQYQHIPVEPDIVAQRHSRRSASSSSTGPLHLMTVEERQRIRPIPDLSIRDEVGHSYVPRQLRLEEMRLEPQHFVEVFRDIPQECLIGESIWNVFAAFDLGADAPAT